MGAPERILVLGGGYVGLYTCLGLERALRGRQETDITMVSTESFMQYQPFLPEAAAGNIEPRHVVVPLRRTLKRTRVIVGEATAVDHPARTATIRPAEGAEGGRKQRASFDGSRVTETEAIFEMAFR